MKISSRKASFYLLLTGLSHLLCCAYLPVLSESAAKAAETQTDEQNSSTAGAQTSKPDTLSEESESGKAEAGHPESPASESKNPEEAAAAMELPASASKHEHEHKKPVSTKGDPFRLGPGQKLKIEGFADKKEPVVVDAADSQTSSYKQANMRMTGSLCYACLMELQEKLMHVYGVERASITKNEQVSLNTNSAYMPSWADAQIIYNPERLDLLDLKVYIRNSGYFPYKVSEKTLNSLPPETQSRKHR